MLVHQIYVLNAGRKWGGRTLQAMLQHVSPPPFCVQHSCQPIALKSFVQLQFVEAGCDNCRFLEMDDDRDAVANLTTPNFTG